MKPIGMPASTPVPSTPTKNTTSAQLPMAATCGAASARASATTAITPAAVAVSRHGRRPKRRTLTSSISRQPTGTAAALTESGRPSAGVCTNISSCA